MNRTHQNSNNIFTAAAYNQRQQTAVAAYNSFEQPSYLGTITHVTNTLGTVLNEYSFDAWGRRRNFTDWGYAVATQTDLLPDRGFTGHEYLDNFKLYNMNGRLYDPVVGRFLSPDENVQMPGYTQNFNRYSYALNNPLVYTDPDGEIIFTLLAAVFFPPALPFAIAADIGGIINTASNWQSINSAGGFWNSLGKGSLFYLAGGANGALSVTANPVGIFAGGAIEELSNGLITRNTDDLAYRSIIGGGTQVIGGKIAGKFSKHAQKGLTKLGLTNKLAKSILSDIAGAIPGNFAATSTNSYFGKGKNVKESLKDGVRSIPSAVVSGTASGISNHISAVQRTQRIDKLRNNPDPFDYYNDNFNWSPSNNMIPLRNAPSYTPHNNPTVDWWKLFSPSWYMYPWEK